MGNQVHRVPGREGGAAVSGFSSADLDALEKPKRRKHVHVGKAKDDTGVKERYIQRQIRRALRQIGVRSIHIPNGAHLAGGAESRMRQMSALKADGVVPGFPDLLVWKPVAGWSPLVGLLEVKRPGGVLEPHQIAVADDMGRDGWPVRAVCDVDGAIAVMREWGWI